MWSPILTWSKLTISMQSTMVRIAVDSLNARLLGITVERPQRRKETETTQARMEGEPIVEMAANLAKTPVMEKPQEIPGYRPVIIPLMSR